MAKKNTAEVLINSKIYTISGYESTAYLHKVASFLNELEEDISKMENYNLLSVDEKHLLKNMNLADVYFKAKDAKEELERQAEKKDKEIYSLKHDLIDARMEKDQLLPLLELELEFVEDDEPLLLVAVLQYVVLIAAVLLFTWISGFFSPLHPKAYVDMFRSFTVPYVIAALVYYGSLYLEVQKANQLLRQIKEDSKNDDK